MNRAEFGQARREPGTWTGADRLTCLWDPQGRLLLFCPMSGSREMDSLWEPLLPAGGTSLDLLASRRASPVTVVEPDEWQVDRASGTVTVTHRQPRRSLFMPGLLGDNFPGVAYRNERLTRAWPVSRPGPEQSGPPICLCDNWRIVQARELDIGLWTGTTTLVFQGYGLPWLMDADNDPGGAGPHEDGESEEDIDDSTEYEDASLPRSRSRSRTRTPSHGRAGADRGGEGKGPGTSGESETVLHPEAIDYLNTINGLDQPTKQGWERVLDAGDALLGAAGGVQEAAQWLWDARATHGLANLRGVEDPCLDKILHPDLLAYLRHVKRHGMEARHVGPRERATAGLHPNAKRNLEQVYAQIWKDVKKHRVLLQARIIPNWATLWLPLSKLSQNFYQTAQCRTR